MSDGSMLREGEGLNEMDSEIDPALLEDNGQPGLDASLLGMDMDEEEDDLNDVTDLLEDLPDGEEGEVEDEDRRFA